MRRLCTPVLALGALAAAGCGAGQEPDLVVYASLDQVHSERIIQLFEERTGLEVDAQYDVERNKTVGMVNRIILEKDRPRADVYWNNEIAHTIRLKNAGLTQAYASPSAEGIPAGFKDPDGHWTGFAARARVIMSLPELVGEAGVPSRIEDLIDPRWADDGGMAAPLTGTTLTHFSVLSQQLGAEAVLDWLGRAKQSGLHIGRGNADVMRQVSQDHDYAWCMTDTDDAAAARRNGHPVEVHYPDQEEGGKGTLLIPNTVCLIAGARHPEAAQRFIDFVLSAEVEELLAHADSEQIPLRPGVPAPDHVKMPGRDFRPMEVDWVAAAAELEARQPDFQELFTE
jgi:iron(III) transport system substrate-binding protein